MKSELEYLELLKEYGLLVRAPGRINLIGEHTDYNQGLCMPATIDRSIYLGLNNSEKWSIEAIDTHETWEQGQSWEPDWLVYFKGAIQLAKEKNLPIMPLKLAFGGSLPAGAGLSSSSSICCGFCFALNGHFNWQMDLGALTKFAVKAERQSGLEGGMMDQISILNGKEGNALLIDCKDWTFTSYPMALPDHRWLIVDTKIKHKLVDTDYNARSQTCQQILLKLQKEGQSIKALGEVDGHKLDMAKNLLNEEQFPLLKYQVEENERVRKFALALVKKDSTQLGNILLEGHRGLKDMYKVSCDELDFLVDFASKDPRAAGARMMGGGFGGSSIHLVEKNTITSYQSDIAAAYHQQFGIHADFFEAEVSDGLKRLK
ncbi:MAG: hypothetical protein IPO62_06700 [Saprospiraceae bacterium]|nr:hypothetical protein [Saprospiraceae bacterium]